MRKAIGERAWQALKKSAWRRWTSFQMREAPTCQPLPPLPEPALPGTPGAPSLGGGGSPALIPSGVFENGLLPFLCSVPGYLGPQLYCWLETLGHWAAAASILSSTLHWLPCSLCRVTRSPVVSKVTVPESVPLLPRWVQCSRAPPTIPGLPTPCPVFATAPFSMGLRQDSPQ